MRWHQILQGDWLDLLVHLSHSLLINCSIFSLLLGNMLPAIAFSLKFLQWWYSDDQRWEGLGSLPAPPPPSTPPVSYCILNTQMYIKFYQIIFSHTHKEYKWPLAPPTVHYVSIHTPHPLHCRPVDMCSVMFVSMTTWRNMAAVL